MRGVVIVGVLSVGLLGCAAEETGACEDDGFGVVMLELRRSPGEAGSVFAGTASIEVNTSFDACLNDYYASEEPGQRLTGVYGREVKEKWMGGRLCDQGCYDEPIAVCTPTEMSQTVNNYAPPDVGYFSVRYEIDSDALEGARLPVGPFATKDRTGCEPLVSVVPSGVQGFDAEGNCLWQYVSGGEMAEAGGSGDPIAILTARCD